MMQAVRIGIDLPQTKMPWRLVEHRGKVVAINPQHQPLIVQSGNIIKELKNVD